MSKARARLAATNADPLQDTDLRDLERQARDIEAELASIESEVLRIVDVPLEALENAEPSGHEGQRVDQRPRQSVRASAIAPTGMIDDVLPAAIARFESKVDRQWLDGQRGIYRGLSSQFGREPLSLIRGVRVASERAPIHRFANTIFTAQDFVEGRLSFDWFAGAALLPQFAALEANFDRLASVGGDVSGRIASLWTGASDSVDSTIYELLVAAGCVRARREVSFLPVRRGGPKTPDLEVQGYPFPVYVECKRKLSVTKSDEAEDSAMRALFTSLRAAASAESLWGVIDLELVTQPDKVRADDLTTAFTRQRYALRPSTPTDYSWGRLSFRELPSRIRTGPTRLYSPYFLKSVFGWDTDLPTHDGIVCQVEPTDELVVVHAERPLAVVWNNQSPSSLRRRTRSIAALFGDAVRQMPPGCVGIIYVAYNEGNRELVADERLRLAEERLRDWTHEWHIRLPIVLINRLIPRPLENGAPDLIETAIQLVSNTYGDTSWFADFPATVFTPPFDQTMAK